MDGGEEYALQENPAASNSSNSSDSESTDDSDDTSSSSQDSSSSEESEDGDDHQEDGGEGNVDLGEIIQNLQGDEHLNGVEEEGAIIQEHQDVLQDFGEEVVNQEGGNNEALQEGGGENDEEFIDILGVGDDNHVNMANNAGAGDVAVAGGEGEFAGDGETTSEEEGEDDVAEAGRASSASSSNK